MAEPSAAASEANISIINLSIISKTTYIAVTDAASVSENINQEMAITQ
jgi:hypothetical protein